MALLIQSVRLQKRGWIDFCISPCLAKEGKNKALQLIPFRQTTIAHSPLLDQATSYPPFLGCYPTLMLHEEVCCYLEQTGEDRLATCSPAQFRKPSAGDRFKFLSRDIWAPEANHTHPAGEGGGNTDLLREQGRESIHLT